MNKSQIGDIEHALRNGNRFYTEENDTDWNELVEKGFATKHSGWESDMAYFKVTNEGKQAIRDIYENPELVEDGDGGLLKCYESGTL
jgi:hypothetical protein